jgi:uncharacterized protein
MGIKKIRKPLSQFVQQIPKSIQVDQVYIFGSYLEGNATEDSDIDVIVVSNDFHNMDDDKRLAILSEAARNIELDIEAWGFTNQEIENADELSTLWYARTSGIPFLQ